MQFVVCGCCDPKFFLFFEILLAQSLQGNPQSSCSLQELPASLGVPTHILGNSQDVVPGYESARCGPEMGLLFLAVLYRSAYHQDSAVGIKED